MPLVVNQNPIVFTGSDAFYNQADYEKVTTKELSQLDALPATYTFDTTTKVQRIAKLILAIVIFPIGLYLLLHALVGKIVMIASFLYSKEEVAECRAHNMAGDAGWKHKRFSIEVDGYTVDAMIIGKEDTFANGRWTIGTFGNGETYESRCANPWKDGDFRQLLTETNSNAIVFNYPGVGASSGLPNREAVKKAYRAMLSLVEDQNIGFKAKEIIGFGHSLGAGIQADALNDYELKENIKYLFIKSKTFSNLHETINSMMFRPLGFLAKLLGWNIDSAESSRKLKAHEIIMQTVSSRHSDVLTKEDAHLIIHDDVIAEDVSLAKALLQNDTKYTNKTFLGVSEGHNYPFDAKFLGQHVNEILAGA